MTGSSRPWQYEWKRPQWKSPLSIEEDDQRHVAGRTLAITSTQVSLTELTMNYPSLVKNDANGFGTLVMTLSVVSTRKNDIGDLVRVDIIHQGMADDSTSGNNDDRIPAVERIASSSLRWPTALEALEEIEEEQEGNGDEEKGDGGKDEDWRKHLPPWLGGFNSKQQAASRPAVSNVGVISACFCRKPPEDDRVAAVDALDVVTFMSLGLPHELLPEVEVTTTTNNSAPASSQTATELLLACLCNNGKVYFYSPWKLLDPEDDDGEDDLTMGMASFLLGDTLHHQMQHSILPLSQPMARVTLTVPIKQPNRSPQPKTVDRDTPDKNHNVPSSKDDDSNLLPLWDSVVWDSTVDPSTTIYNTSGNIPSLCVSAFDYVAIAGRGKCARRPNKKPLDTKEVGSREEGSTNSEVEKIKADNAEEESISTKNSMEDLPTSGSLEQETLKEEDEHENGGFVTFLSLRHFSEARTVFLPFPPQKLSSFVWGCMSFVLVIGKGVAVAIRVDASDSSHVVCGEAPLLLLPNLENVSPSEVAGTGNNPDASVRQIMCHIQRFQILPVQLPGIDHRSVMAGSSAFTSPPGVAIVFQQRNKNELLVVHRTFQGIDRVLTENAGPFFHNYRRSLDGRTTAIETSYAMGHEARISLPRDVSQNIMNSRNNDTWCHLGQGWCLVGASNYVYFVCFEGATALRGAHVHELDSLSQPSSSSSNEYFHGLSCDIMPPNPFYTAEQISGSTSEKLHISTWAEDVVLPFTDQYQPTEIGQESIKNNGRNSGDNNHLDDTVIDALESISNLDYRDSVRSSHISPRVSSPRRKPSTISLSSREKSKRLLENCSSWTELEYSNNQRQKLEDQVPAVIICGEYQATEPFVLTLRKIVVENGIATPFHEVLSWLSNKEDYFTAASLALDLLRDAEALRHLWRAFEKIDDDDERTKLEGLLDGIIPIWKGSETPRKSNLTKLADMTAGCLTKGGFSMSSTLENFLRRDQHYDTARVSLMLIATAACSVSEDKETVASVMRSEYVAEEKRSNVEDLLWPIRCLLQIGVARNYLSTSLVLLNVTIPDELRRRQRTGLPSTSRPSKDLCMALVTLIVASSPDAAESLLGLVDEQERTRYWPSLQHDMQLSISLIRIDDASPMLRQPEVRCWALENLHSCIEQESCASAATFEFMPTQWLKQLCMACLLNAGCNVDILLGKEQKPNAEEGDNDVGDEDGLTRHIEEVQVTRSALRAAEGRGGLDFDLLIPALLILEHRSELWGGNVRYSTQSILNAACSIACRVGSEEPYFATDGVVLMRQCTHAGNVSAGANLVGGKNGLTLECCAILIEETRVSMEQAENYLFGDELHVVQPLKVQPMKRSEFAIGDGHRQVLWLLHEHVLTIRTYGEFETTQMRGRVDPVFAAKMCLRTWLALTISHVAYGSKWLARWLRRQLGIKGDIASKRRLACAALTRALLWSDRSIGTSVLSTQLEMENRFLVQLCQSCWNLVESVPPWIANEILDT